MTRGALVSLLLLQGAINQFSSLFLVSSRFIFFSSLIYIWYFFCSCLFLQGFLLIVNSKKWDVVETDLCIDFEEIGEEDDDDDLRTEYQCPYCTDDFDLVELCFHVEVEHYLEAKSGVFYFTILL